MTRQLNPLLRRALALTLLLATLYAGYGLVRPIHSAYADNAAAIEQLEHALARYRSAGRDLPALEQRLAEVERPVSGQAGYLAGSNVGIVAAALQAQLKGLVLRAGGEIKSSLVLPGKTDSVGQRIAVRIQMVASIAPLQQVLHDIEAANPLLLVDALDVRVISRSHQAADEEPLLDIRFDVSGFVRGSP
jgi:general secretion pathway protein M